MIKHFVIFTVMCLTLIFSIRQNGIDQTDKSIVALRNPLSLMADRPVNKLNMNKNLQGKQTKTQHSNRNASKPIIKKMSFARKNCKASRLIAQWSKQQPQKNVNLKNQKNQQQQLSIQNVMNNQFSQSQGNMIGNKQNKKEQQSGLQNNRKTLSHKYHHDNQNNQARHKNDKQNILQLGNQHSNSHQRSTKQQNSLNKLGESNISMHIGVKKSNSQKNKNPSLLSAMYNNHCQKKKKNSGNTLTVPENKRMSVLNKHLILDRHSQKRSRMSGVSDNGQNKYQSKQQKNNNITHQMVLTHVKINSQELNQRHKSYTLQASNQAKKAFRQLTNPQKVIIAVKSYYQDINQASISPINTQNMKKQSPIQQCFVLKQILQGFNEVQRNENNISSNQYHSQNKFHLRNENEQQHFAKAVKSINDIQNKQDLFQSNTFKNKDKLSLLKLNHFLHGNDNAASLNPQGPTTVQKLQQCAKLLEERESSRKFRSPFRHDSKFIQSPSFFFLYLIVDIIRALQMLQSVQTLVKNIIQNCLQNKITPNRQFTALLHSRHLPFLDLMSSVAKKSLDELLLQGDLEQKPQGKRDYKYLQNRIGNLRESCFFVLHSLSDVVNTQPQASTDETFMLNLQSIQQINQEYQVRYQPINQDLKNLQRTSYHQQHNLKGIYQQLKAFLSGMKQLITLLQSQIQVIVNFHFHNKEGTEFQQQQWRNYYQKMILCIASFKAEIKQQRDILKKIELFIRQFKRNQFKKIQNIVQNYNQRVLISVKTIAYLQSTNNVMRMKRDNKK